MVEYKGSVTLEEDKISKDAGKAMLDTIRQYRIIARRVCNEAAFFATSLKSAFVFIGKNLLDFYNNIIILSVLYNCNTNSQSVYLAFAR